MIGGRGPLKTRKIAKEYFRGQIGKKRGRRLAWSTYFSQIMKDMESGTFKEGKELTNRSN